MYKVIRHFLQLVPIFILGVPSCWVQDALDDSYVYPACSITDSRSCNPGDRCVPAIDGQARCEQATSLGNQDAFCETHSDCGMKELCLPLHPNLPSKICAELCQENHVCPDGYQCQFTDDEKLQFKARNEKSGVYEEWGGCVMFPPRGWSCDENSYAGGRIANTYKVCDCGCGTFDPDCESTDEKSCESCANEFKRLCVPDGWECDLNEWQDGNCDCGCGIIDNECEIVGSSGCDECPAGSCAENIDGGCNSFHAAIRPDDNSKCKTLPPNWNCTLGEYFDGIICDCGCGATDPDCANANSGNCERCPEDSCAHSTDDKCIFNVIVSADNALCIQQGSE